MVQMKKGITITGENEPKRMAMPTSITTPPRYIGFLVCWKMPFVTSTVAWTPGGSGVPNWRKSVRLTAISINPISINIIPTYLHRDSSQYPIGMIIPRTTIIIIAANKYKGGRMRGVDFSVFISVWDYIVNVCIANMFDLVICLLHYLWMIVNFFLVVDRYSLKLDTHKLCFFKGWSLVVSLKIFNPLPRAVGLKKMFNSSIRFSEMAWKTSLLRFIMKLFDYKYKCSCLTTQFFWNYFFKGQKLLGSFQFARSLKNDG